MISSLAEHVRKCLKVEYLSRNEYDFQKTHVTGPWDHKVLVSAIKVKKKFHACVPLIYGDGALLWVHPPLVGYIYCDIVSLTPGTFQ